MGSAGDAQVEAAVRIASHLALLFTVVVVPQRPETMGTPSVCYWFANCDVIFSLTGREAPVAVRLSPDGNGSSLVLPG